MLQDSQIEFSDQMTAEQVVEVNIQIHGYHTLLTKVIHIIDGLKPIHRYVLWTIHKESSKQKTSAIAGIIMSKYHPVGDGSIAAAITRLTQPHANLIPLVYSDSNIGTYAGEDPAKPRYLDVEEHAFTNDVYFSRINTRVFNYIQSDTGVGVVPEYFVPKIPMALLTGFFGIAIGYRSLPIRLNLHSLCSMVMDYCELRSMYGDHIPYGVKLERLSHYVLPDFPTACVLRNRQQLMDKYKQGEFNTTVITDGTMHVSPSMITIKTLPPDISIRDVYLRLGELRAKKDPFVEATFQEILDASTERTEACIECTLKRGVNVFQVLTQFKKLINFTKSWTPDFLVVDKDTKSRHVSPIDVLESWYTERVRVILAELKLAQGEFVERIRQLKAQLIIVDHLDRVVELFKSSITPEATIKPLCEEFNLTQYQAKYLSKLTLGQITGTGKEKLLAEQAEVEARIAAMQHKFLTIDEQIKKDAETILNKYSKDAPRKCVCPGYAGYAKIGGGYIQYIDEHELIGILGRFGHDNVVINSYQSGPRYKVMSVSGGKIDMEEHLVHPKEFAAAQYSVVRCKPKYTVCLRRGTIYRCKGISTANDKYLVCTYVGDQYLAISKAGIVTRERTTDLCLKDRAVSTGEPTELCHVDATVDDEVIVVYCNSHAAENNIVRIDRVAIDNKLNRYVYGKLHIVGVFKVKDTFMVTIPSEFLTRTKVRHLRIDGTTVGPTGLRLDLGRKTVNDGRKLISYQNSQIHTLSS